MNDISHTRPGALRAGELIVDRGTETVSLNGQVVTVRGRNFDVLVLLMERAPNVVTKNEILDAVWSGIPVTESVLTTALKDIRQAIADSARNPTYIETRHGSGYRFLKSVEIVSVADSLLARSGWLEGKHRLIALVGLVVLLGISVFSGYAVYTSTAGDNHQPRISVASNIPRLAQAVNDALLPTGLRDATAANQEFRLALTARPAINADQIEILLTDLTGDTHFLAWDIDASALTFDQRARRISIELSNVIRCSDSLIAEAAETGLNAQSLRSALMRYCLAAQRPSENFDTVSIATTIYERLPDEPFAMALLSLSISIKPEQYFFGQSVEQVVLLRQEARYLAQRASEIGGESSVVFASRLLASDLHLSLPTILDDSASVMFDSWAGARVGFRRSIQLRQLGRIEEARFLLNELEMRWPGYQDVRIFRAVLDRSTGRPEVVEQLAAVYLSLYPNDVSLSQIANMAFMFYGSPSERETRISQLPETMQADSEACFTSLSVPESSRHSLDIQAIMSACIAIDLTIGARVMAMLGFTDLSTELLERIDPDASGISVIFYYPEFASVRETERFANIASSFGLIDAWRITRRLPDFCHEQIDAPACIQSIFE